jgi:uncharacterized protein (DUF58 family)
MKSAVTPLLPNRVLDGLGRLRINPARHFTNRSRGEHLARKGGSSVEFHDYRDYAAGDDVRFVDWNIFSRLNRPYLKLFREEEEMHVVILVDGSSSMQFEGKHERAKQLAAAFGVMGLRGIERVSVYGFRSAAGAPARLAPCTGRASLMKLLAFVESLGSEGGDAPLERGIEAMLKRHRGRGVALLLSDFLTTGDMRRAFNLLHSAGLETMALQILGPTEIDPGMTGDLRLVDSESETHVDVSSAAYLLELYHEHRENFQRDLAEACRQRAGRFLATNAADPIETVILDQLRRKGWVR